MRNGNTNISCRNWKFLPGLALMLLTATSVFAYESPVHVFSIQDVQGGFDGTTFGLAGTEQDTSIICGVSDAATCPDTISPVTDKEGVTLYPIDSEFGFEVIDFLGAKTKERNQDYMEGFAGNITDGNAIVGIKISNSATDTYKVKPPFGTWCQGLGGTSVKCSTEHYVVMEHALSCHEVVPYSFADPITGTQQIIKFEDGSNSFDCAGAGLNDELNVIAAGQDTGIRFTDTNQIQPNDNTSVLNDIALSSDYSLTLKDDGKALYRWGGLIKRPNDVRLYARLPLPDEWKERDEISGELVNDFPISSATLVVKHWITNNPNDQLRPEDLENEAATGRIPSHKRDSATGNWVSTKPCYEGDGDFLDTEEGSTDPEFIDVGTVYANRTSPFDPNNPDNPIRFSADLRTSYSNAAYTTIDRDPFEWSYDTNPDPLINEYVGSLVPDDSLGVLDSGPRWRLRANKFGQDIPGLEIPLIECSPPPFKSDNIKYEVGEPATTVINLLDWDEAADGPSPLATSKGWVDVYQNGAVEVEDVINGIPVTTNGLPMTEDFDLAVYVKGDRKSTAVFSAQLFINEDVPPVVDPESDVSISRVQVPGKVFIGVTKKVKIDVTNDAGAEAAASGVVTIMSTSGDPLIYTQAFTDLEPGDKENIMFDWTAPFVTDTTLWTVTVSVDDEVVDTQQATTEVRNKRRGNK